MGIDFALANSEDHVVAYGVDRGSTSDDEPSPDDHLQVTAFHLGTSLRLHEFLNQVFKRVSVRLLSSSVSGRELVVAEHTNLDGASASVSTLQLSAEGPPDRADVRAAVSIAGSERVSL